MLSRLREEEGKRESFFVFFPPAKSPADFYLDLNGQKWLTFYMAIQLQGREVDI